MAGILDDQDVDPRRFVGRGVEHIGAVDEIAVVDAAYVLCLGWPWTRHAVAERIGERGRPLLPIVHPSADSAWALNSVRVRWCWAMHTSRPSSALGAHALVSYSASVGHDTTFGDHASLMPNAAVSGECRGGHRVLVGTGAVVREEIHIGDDAGWARELLSSQTSLLG